VVPVLSSGSCYLIEIDGAEKSGSGTLVRFAVALCSLTSQPMHMVRIRERREKPGLRPQHLLAVRACASLTTGHLEGDSVGSREIVYYPGKTLHSGAYDWDIGTAGSATMMAFTLVPLALFAEGESQFRIRGGLFQDFAPTAFHMQYVLLPLLSQMGASVRLEVARPGYVPRGNGELVVSIDPMKNPLIAFDKTTRGEIRGLKGISLASHLEREDVARRMADRLRTKLGEKGFQVKSGTFNDTTAVQKGAALLLWAETETGCILGFDRAGKRGRRSESIADYVAGSFWEDIGTGATVDRFSADQIIMFAGLAAGRSKYVIPRSTEHIQSNMWLIEKILGARADLNGNLISIDGIGFFRD
jgi:RNA 3'-terminal phosphate cyclase (ATP)